MRSLFACLALVFGLGSTAVADDTTNHWAVALPTSMPSERAALERALWGVFIDTLRPGDRYRVENATVPGRIAHISLPKDEAFTRAKRRARHFREENARIHAHLTKMGAGPALVDLPGLLRREALNRVDRETPLALLVIGDMVQIFSDEPSFSMRGEAGGIQIPSDKHLSASLSQTPWGLGDEGPRGLTGVALHLCHQGGEATLSSDA
ncbi:MAG: hypothetical protein AAFU49_12905 [Pseudomonadota bacterium]